MRVLAVQGSIAALFAMAAVLAPEHSARAFPYLVRAGDTAAQIAERMYGRIELERLVVAANGLGDAAGGTLSPGMQLEVPAAGHHRALRGESWSSIAAEECGGAERAHVLARLNGSNPWTPPDVGRELAIPFNLRFVATQGDTTESVAYRFLGRRDDAWMIQSYNRLPRPALPQGQVVLVPIVDLPLTEAGRSAAREAAKRLGGQAGGRAARDQEAAERDLAALAGSVRHGEYVAAVAAGAGALAKGDLTASQEARIFALLTESYAALADKRLAADACAGWKRLQPGLDLDPLRFSPKILAACASAASPSAQP